MNIKIDGPIIYPKESSNAKNAIIFLHGYGANGKDLISIGNVWSEKLKETIFVSPNAPFKCEWGEEAYQWFDLTSIAPEKIGEGLEKAGPFLNNLIEEVKSQFSLNDNQIFFFGFSQGAMMGLYHLCKRKNNCAGLLAYSGLLYENSDFQKKITSQFPIKLYHGKNDEVIDAKYTEESYEKFKKFGFKIEYYIQDGLGHGIDSYGLDLGFKFIQNLIKV